MYPAQYGTGNKTALMKTAAAAFLNPFCSGGDLSRVRDSDGEFGPYGCLWDGLIAHREG